MTDLFMTVLDMSLKASFVILSVYLARWIMCLGNPPRKWCYMLWGIVLIRLLVPVTIESGISSLPDDFAQGFAAKWGNDYIGETHTYFDVTEEFETAVQHGNRPITTDEGGQYVVTGADGISHPKTVKTEIFPFLATLWLIGIAAMLLWNGITLLKLHRKLLEAVPTDHQVYLSDQIETAFVLGWFSPKIYLPANLTPQEQSHILHHERYHIHRRDHRIKLLAFLALCIHWFNPLVWLAFVLAMRDMELSCDEAVTADLDEADKADYAQTLLSLTTGHKQIHAAPVAFGEGDTAERVRHVFRYRDPGRLVTIIVMVLFAVSAVRLLTDPKEIIHTFGATMYGYEKLAYQDYSSSTYYEHPSSFCLTTDNVFWVMDLSYGWEDLGTAEPFPMTTENLNDMMPYRLAMDQQPPVTEITDSKIVRFTDDSHQHLFYLLTRHKTGSYYIAFGTSDSELYKTEQLTIQYLYPVKSGIGKHVAHEPFYQRCLESMLDEPVDVFATHLIGDDYHVVGFRTGVPKTDYGWAVFQIKDNMATFTGQMERFENAADLNDGILLSSPALANDSGEITDKSAYDVILIANPDVASIKIRLTDGSNSKLISYPDLSAPDMVIVPWKETAKADSVAIDLYDANGIFFGVKHQDDERNNLAELELAVRDLHDFPINHFAPGRLSYMTDIAEAYLEDPIAAAKSDLPSGVRDVTVFRGTHPIVQFAQNTLGSSYMGYYYSPDDVPVPFQNAALPLIETDDGWRWQGEGDNHGTTKRIAECWFSYKANL
ncbi:MAG: M56 family metallopeptidase [Oscillospiraceae bacterium]|nr:M56 family metallopeptidase [Oscillospiraceae bacterium]